jgi:hypothetical protein
LLVSLEMFYDARAGVRTCSRSKFGGLRRRSDAVGVHKFTCSIDGSHEFPGLMIAYWF